ncbi:hypothetical protein O2W15_12860 [Modestobacter sp. VKM Ac-2979]|nr:MULTISPECIES: hypothetical protein [unclassified Modestobacter]MCZ2812324.1 hypothetical protein [Modestobacter sp. VKM Ac-2979]MCZ2841214.1 hypothetical protein [Modestobacter sp. VKM Ac-2980]
MPTPGPGDLVRDRVAGVVDPQVHHEGTDQLQGMVIARSVLR